MIRKYCARTVFFLGGGSMGVFGSRPHLARLRGVWFEELKFNKHCSTFVLFDKKFSILD
jgi:hypothetical protein